VSGGRLTVSRARIVAGTIAAALSATLISVPVLADTESELAAARDRLNAVEADLARLASEHALAVGELHRTRDRIARVKDKMAGIEARMAKVQAALDARAREAYETGGAGTIEILLASESFSQFSDRVEYLGRIAQSDGELLVQARVDQESLRRLRADLARESEREAQAVADLASKKGAMAELFAEQQALEARLADKLAAERAAAAAAARVRAQAEARQVGGGPLVACPVGNPHAFWDDFGDPRPGGRTHQGIDMLADYGTPVYAAQTGSFQQESNDLGGISALVYAASGDYTYYAHLQGYAGVGNGAHVPAGTLIGYVGDTGNARGTPHLHFEYHPGGGAAANPYGMLVAVCG
jgi:murein DD-endopeptidase MepM/ murein hydrolase activator NlpD